MAGINIWVACTLGGGVVGRHVCGTEGGGIGGGLVSRRGAWRIGEFTGGTLDGETVGGGPWATVAGNYNVIIVIIVGKDVKWIVIVCMVGADGPIASV